MSNRKNVAIRDIDGDLWNWFVGHCKQIGLSVPHKLEMMINNLKK